MCDWNLFVMLLSNDSSSKYFEWPKNEAFIIKYHHLYYPKKITRL